MRAMVLQINNIDVIDLLKPNDRVDVITIFSAQHAVKGKVKVAVYDFAGYFGNRSFKRFGSS